MEKEKLGEMRKAVIAGDIELIKKLIADNEGILNEVTVFGSWLHVASKHGQLESVKFLFEEGLDINFNAGIADSNSLHQASLYGFLNVVEFLFEKGAVLDTSNATRNPLFAAIYNDHFDVAKFLIDNGIDITIGYDIGTLKNADACEYARQFGRNEIREYLLEKLGRK